MTYEPEQAAVRWSLELARKRVVWIILILLAVWAFILRYLHVINPYRYYLLGADSHFFHWLSGRIMAGEDLPSGVSPGAKDLYTIHTGVAYPLAYIAKAVSSVFNITSTDALEVVSKGLPPFLGIVSLIIIYLISAKLYDRRTGFFAAFTWAIMLHPIFLGASGLIDRDSLSTFLIMLGALLFYLSNGWKLHIGDRDFGWLLAGFGVLAIEGLMYLQWSFVGSALLLALIIVYFAIKLLSEFLSRIKTAPDAKHRVTAALNEVNWRAFAVIIIGNAILAAAFYPQVSSWASYLTNLLLYGKDTPVSELHGIGLRDLTVYHLFLIPMVLGIYIAWKKRSKGTIFFACWFLFYLILSLFSRRILLFAAPAACLLSGVGLMFLWDWVKAGRLRQLKRVSMIVLLLLLLFVSFINAATIGADPVMSVDEKWQDALTYIREETPQDSVIMTQWSWGYWILDLGQRKPLVDNGFYGYPMDKLHDVGLVYAATDPAVVVQIMEKYGADYIIFSTLDRDVVKHIMEWANPSGDYDSFPSDSLVVRSIKGEFESEGGLEVVYHSVPDPESEVVILGLTQSEQP